MYFNIVTETSQYWLDNFHKNLYHFYFKDVRWLQLFIQTFFLTSLFRFKNV